MTIVNSCIKIPGNNFFQNGPYDFHLKCRQSKFIDIVKLLISQLNWKSVIEKNDCDFFINFKIEPKKCWHFFIIGSNFWYNQETFF